jgi:tight adherence protein C
MSATEAIAAVTALTCAALAVAPQRGRSPVELVSASAPRPSSSRARAADLDLHYAEAIELIVLAVRAGHLPLSAIRAVHRHMSPAIGSAFAQVITRCDQGERFADALGELPLRLGERAHTLVDGLAAADRDGLPLAPVLDRLASEARLQRRRRADTAARQLPVRLSLPLVLCTLPAFVLLAVAPLLLAALSSLRQ